MYSFRPSDFDPAATAIVPPYLAVLPSQLRDADGFYASRRYGVLKAQISAAVAQPAT